MMNTMTSVKIMPAYLIQLSTRCRLSISLNTEFESPTVLRTSSAFRCAFWTKEKAYQQYSIASGLRSNTHLNALQTIIYWKTSYPNNLDHCFLLGILPQSKGLKTILLKTESCIIIKISKFLLYIYIYIYGLDSS